MHVNPVCKKSSYLILFSLKVKGYYIYKIKPYLFQSTKSHHQGSGCLILLTSATAFGHGAHGLYFPNAQDVFLWCGIITFAQIFYKSGTVLIKDKYAKSFI